MVCHGPHPSNRHRPSHGVVDQLHEIAAPGIEQQRRSTTPSAACGPIRVSGEAPNLPALASTSM
jgi:hypothetical protein